MTGYVILGSLGDDRGVCLRDPHYIRAREYSCIDWTKRREVKKKKKGSARPLSPVTKEAFDGPV